MVTSTGKLIIVNKDTNPDLFFAIRGGGGNFGIIIEFQLQAYEHNTQEMFGGAMIFPASTLKTLFDEGLRIQESDGRAALTVVLGVSPMDQKVHTPHPTPNPHTPSTSILMNLSIQLTPFS